ncbi:MAG: CocE/NonD family hydrolase, partial [Candidatus Latescibacterota bacterium]
MCGPWNHPGLGRRRTGEIDFGPQAEVDLPDLVIRWFDHWLKGVDNGVDREPAARYFVMGSNQWKAADTWPPRDTAPREYLLASDGNAGPNGNGRLAPAGRNRAEPLRRMTGSAAGPPQPEAR